MIAPNDRDESLIIETCRLIAAQPEVVLVTTDTDCAAGSRLRMPRALARN